MWMPPVTTVPPLEQAFQGQRHQRPDRRKDQRGVKLGWRHHVRGTGPAGAKIAREGLRRIVAIPGKGKDLAPLPDRNLAQDMGRSPKAPDAQLPGRPRHAQRAVADQPGTKQGCQCDRVRRFGKRKDIGCIRQAIFGKTAIPGIAGELRRVAQVFCPAQTIGTAPAGRTKPRHANPLPERELRHPFPQRVNAANDLVSRNQRQFRPRQIAVPAGNLYDAEGLSPLQAALVEFLAIGAQAVRRSDVTKGDRVLVTGAGPIGLGAALFARVTGAEVHLMDLSPERLAAAERLGFTHLHRPGAPLPADGFDVVMDATGNPRAMEAGFAHVAHGGSYVLVSVVKDDLTFNDAEFHKRKMRLIGSRNAQAEDFRQVMEALKSGAVPGEALISTTLPLADLPRRIGELVADRGGIIKAIVALGVTG